MPDHADPSPPTDPPAWPEDASRPPARTAADGRLRDTGSPMGALASWAVVVGMVALIVLSHAMVGSAAPKPATEPSPTAGVLQIFARYTVGAVETLGAGEQRETMLAQLRPTIDAGVASPDDALRASLVAHGLGDDEWARALLRRITDPGGPDAEPLLADDPALRPAYIAQDADRIQTLLDHGVDSLAPDDRSALLDHHGWFAEFGFTAGAPESDPARRAAVAPAQRTLFAVGALALVGGAGLLAGIVLLIVMLVKVGNGSVRARYARPAPGGSVYLETFAIFLVGFVGLGLIGEAIYSATGVDLSNWLVWLLPLVLLWPVARGARPVEAKYALGWSRGEGALTEIGAGLVGYLAGLPVVALGFGLTVLISIVMSGLTGAQGPPPSHPVVQQAGVGGVWSVLSVYLLASVWAPIVEESVFRGAFFHHLRGRLGPAASATVVGFVFAIIHPQGILLVPPLMALGFVFSMIREWRGSIIGPMAAHAVHNAILVTVLLTALS